MTYNKSSRLNQYLAMTSSERRRLAFATGETTAKGLTQKDSVLAVALRRKGEMAAFLMERRNFGRRNYYASLSADELVNHALVLSKEKGFEYMSQLQAADAPLYDALRERQLTSKMADLARFKGNRRRTSGRVYNKSDKRKESRRSRYAAMTDKELFTAVQKTKVVGSKILNKYDSALYAEVMVRPEVRQRLVELGWRRPFLHWEDMTLDDWVQLCGQYDSKEDFRQHYGAARAHAIKSGLWSEICQILVKQGRWKAIYGMDGLLYDSRAESIVANWLHLSGIQYEPHPLLPWRFGRRPLQADLRLVDYRVWIEVFFCSVDGLKHRTDAPSWAPEYIRRRFYKEQRFASDPEKKLLVVEAEIYRYKGLKAYLTHIHEQCMRLGIELVDPGAARLDIGYDRRGVDWSLQQFLDYAEIHHFTKISDFQDEGHRDLYAVLASRKMRKDLTRALADKNGILIHATQEVLLPVDELRTACHDRNIRFRKQYEAARKACQLPEGTPASIRQSYGITWTKFITGKDRFDFLPWEKARALVRLRHFKSRDEFLQAVRNEPEMKYIRRNPSNPKTGGYPEWTNWYDFLGK